MPVSLVVGALGATGTYGTVALMADVAIGITVGTTMYAAKQQEKAQSAAEKKAEAKRREAEEYAAGEYYDINLQQMNIQALQSQTQQLSDILTTTQQAEPRIFTLPSAENPDALSRINKAIDDIVKGRW